MGFVYLFFLPVLLPSEVPRLTTEPPFRVFPGVWKLLSFLRLPSWGGSPSLSLFSLYLLYFFLLLLLLLSCFSRVRLCVTPETAAHQALPSLGFSRQEHWSGLPFPSPMRESEVAQSCPTLSDPMDCSLPGSSIHGIFQVRVLKWGAIAFSGI